MTGAEIVKIDGAPGVGKTTKLFDYVEEEKAAGRSLTDFYYCTFARSGIEESTTRLAECFPDADKEDVGKRARTFHGAAWMACFVGGVFDEPSEQIIQRGTHDDVYEQFCNRKGLSYAEEDKNPLKAAHDGEDVTGNGNRLFAINDYLTLTRKPKRKHGQAPVSLPLGHDRVVALLEEWEEFKQTAFDLPLYEHGDYVDEAIEQGLTPPAEVLFLDEFQDLSPQEYLLFKTWRDSGQFDRIYIAGDPNQSIYSFRAGSPLYFEETDVNTTELLKTSHRCPAEIVDVARGILEACDDTDPKGFTAARSGGAVEDVSVERGEALADFVKQQVADHDPADSGESVFLLTRANYQAYKLSSVLREHGIPFQWLGSKTGVWEEPMPQLLRALRTLQREGGGIPTESTNRLLKLSPGEKKRRERIGERMGDVYKVEDVWKAYPDADDVVDIVQMLDLYEYQRDLLASAAVSQTDRSHERVKIGTIHSAKGLEAPCVLLFDAYTPRLEEAYYDGDITAEEHRLYYVGATRASQSLYVVRDFFNGAATPIFDDGIPRYKGEVVA